MKSRTAFLLLSLLALLLVTIFSIRQLQAPKTTRDPELEAVIQKAAQARDASLQFRQAGGKRGDAKDPARKSAGELWKYREEHPGTSAARRAASETFMLLHVAGQTEEMFAKAETLAPDDPLLPSILWRLFASADEKKDYSRFILIAHAALERSQNKGLRAQMEQLLGRAYAEQGDVVRARAAFEQVFLEAPTLPDSNRTRQLLYELDHFRVGLPAPEFIADGLDARPVRLTDFRGKVVVLDFWATWCAPCVMEFPVLKELNAKFASRGVVILAVSIDSLEERERVRSFVANRQIPWPQVIDGKHGGGAVARLYNIPGVPSHDIVDREGRIAAKNVAIENLEQQLTKILDKSPSP